MPIDTLKSKRRLVEEYGLDDRQAEGIVELMAQSEERGATASDVDAAKREILLRLENEIASAEERTNKRIEQLRLDMEQMRRQMLQWMLGIAAFITVLLTLFEYVL
jgi:F0F1-type ATP synthase membrane subunit b/b'